MSRRCQITGVTNMSGNNVSHSNRKTKRVFKVNIHKVRFWSELLKRHYSVKLTSNSLRTLHKLGGFDNYLLSLNIAQITDFAKQLKKKLSKIITDKAAN